MNPLSALEAILFVAGKPLSEKVLIKILGLSVEVVREQLSALENRYNTSESGLRLLRNDDTATLVTSAEVSGVISKYLRSETNGELTRPSLETLAVVAYRGPVTKPEIEQIRGVQCSLILRNLLVRGLIEEISSEQEPHYRVTAEFLEHLGATSVLALPDFEALRNHPELENALRKLNETSSSLA